MQSVSINSSKDKDESSVTECGAKLFLLVSFTPTSENFKITTDM